eukprot:2683094-Amphidinium_carterae.1
MQFGGRLKVDGQSQKDDRKAALNAALRGVRAHSAFQVGDFVCDAARLWKSLEHSIHHCPRWNKELCRYGSKRSGFCRRPRRFRCRRTNLLRWCVRVWTLSGHSSNLASGDVGLVA